MQPISLLLLFAAYFSVIITISHLISRNNKASSFYNGDRKSPWFIVAFGMIGATLSGVTFISVPGEVGHSAFYYLQFVLGNFIGDILIATLLLPFYYKKNIYSIYTILSEKMGKQGYLTTSGFFILSKIIGAAFRLYLAALVIHMAIAKPLGISFELTVIICLILIWLYTYKSGIKAVVWSDTIQTTVLILAVIATIFTVTKQLNIDFYSFKNDVIGSNYPVFDFNWDSSNNFFKQFVAGIFMTLALNGFDQDIIQKNLTCKNSKKARNNMLIFSIMFVVSVFLFLIMGALLYYYAGQKGIAIPTKTDQLFPLLALNHFGKITAALFILGISAAAFSSADSATTALTTAVGIDFLHIEQYERKKQVQIRNYVHAGISLVLFGVIILFYKMNNQSVVTAIFKAAGYTYGPILGVFIFSFFINRKPISWSILPICISAPLLTYLTTIATTYIFPTYKFGFELIIINSLFTLLLLILFSRRESKC